MKLSKKTARKTADPGLELSALFFVNGEKKQDLCEDSYALGAHDGEVFLGVFDGCGGSGARVYDVYGGHTGAYLASRIASGAAYDWFQNEEPPAALERDIARALQCYKENASGSSGIRSSMAKDFPTTAAAAKCSCSPSRVDADFLWCGDSRGFLMTADGLKQITVDDVQHTVDGPDMRSDGIMTSVCSASKPFHLHEKQVSCSQPCIALTATDGCFGYVESPIRFEALLLDTLLQSSSIEDWREKLFGILKKISADDYTMCLACFGYASFADLKKAFEPRHKALLETYLAVWNDSTQEQQQQLWLEYAADYLSEQDDVK